MDMRWTVGSAVLMVLVAVGCQSPPSGAASRGGFLPAAMTERVQKLASVNSAAYANFASAVMLHAESDRLLGEMGALSVTTPAERKRLFDQANDLWNQAVTQYQRALAYDPAAVEVCQRLGKGCFDRGDYDGGVRWLKRAVDLDDGNFSLLYQLGTRTERAGKLSEAVQAYARAQKARDSADKRKLLPLVLLKLGGLYESLKNLPEAAAAYTRFIELKKEGDDVYEHNSALIELMDNKAPVYRRLGEVCSRMGRHAEAAAAYEVAYRLQPTVTDSLLEVASSYAEAGNYARALAASKEYIEKEPGRLDGMALMVEVYRKMGQPDKAQTAAEEFLKEKPLLYQLHYLLGTLHEEKGELDKAAGEYEMIVRDRKQFVPAYMNLAGIEAKRGRYDQVLAVLAKGLSAGLEDEVFYAELDRRISEAAKVSDTPDRFRLAVDPKDHDFAFYYVLGRLWQEMKKNDEAVKAYQETVRLSPDFIQCYVRLASIYIIEDKADEAVKVLKSAGVRAPDSLLVWRFLADAQLAADDLPGAVDSMKQVVRLDPDNTLSILTLVSLMDKAGRSAEAERLLEQGLAEHPDDEERWTWILASYYIDNHRKLDRAVQLLSDAVREYPDSERLNAALGYAFFKRRDYAQAVETLRRAVKLEPDDLGTRTYLALALERDGKTGEAEKELRDALKQKSDDRGLLIELGRFLVRTGKVDEGIATVNRAVAADPKDPSGRMALGGAYLELKRYPEAISVFTALLRENPGYSMVRYQLAMVYDEMDEFDKAEAELRGILKEDPNDGPAANALGYLFAERSVRLDEAEKLIETALKQDPQNGAYLDSMGWVLYRRGDINRALEYLKMALDREPDAVIAEHLGDVYFKLGQKDQAVARYKEAVEIDPKNTTAPKKIELLQAGKDPLADGK